jgi:hypothetical protein
MGPLPWHATPPARAWTCLVPSRSPAAFHIMLPDYSSTSLIDVSSLAASLAVGTVLVKDESSRLGLPSFKALGASWAVHQLLVTEAGEASRGPHGLPGLRRLAAARPGLVLVTATDGNHGRAVARMARLVGAAARVVVPAAVTGQAVAAIAAEGAEVATVPGGYDEAVAAAARWAHGQPGALLVQDTAWPGYEQVPGWIAEGYSTLFAELDEQLPGHGAPALVVVPVGVGSLAQVAIAHYRGSGRGTGTALLTVEPDTRRLRPGQPARGPAGHGQDRAHRHGRAQLRHRVRPRLALPGRRAGRRHRRVRPAGRTGYGRTGGGGYLIGPVRCRVAGRDPGGSHRSRQRGTAGRAGTRLRGYGRAAQHRSRPTPWLAAGGPLASPKVEIYRGASIFRRRGGRPWRPEKGHGGPGEES